VSYDDILNFLLTRYQDLGGRLLDLTAADFAAIAHAAARAYAGQRDPDKKRPVGRTTGVDS